MKILVLTKRQYMGKDLLDDLCAGENVFFAATGITAGELLDGVRFQEGGLAHTQSLVMRSYSGTVRWIDAQHDLARLRLRAAEPGARSRSGSP